MGGAVLSYDAVCIFNKENASVSKSFSKILTNRGNTEINMAQNQYFSPYQEHTVGLISPVLKIYQEVIKMVERGEVYFLQPPPVAEMKEMNRWWERVRYGK